MPVVPAMKAERLSVDDVMGSVREQGIGRLSDVRVAVLEADGKLSFFTGQDKEGAPDSTPAG